MAYSKLPHRLVLFILLALSLPVFATSNVTETAMSGYDVVSYFTKNKAEKGNSQYTYQHKGKTYQFSSAKHRDTFAISPEKYLPQYDGFCAYGVTFGEKLKASLEAWKIVNGKLYLNLN